MKLQRLNESYSVLNPESNEDEIKIEKIFNFLKVLRPGAYFEPAVKAGFKSPYDFFSNIQNGKLLLMNGHIDLLKNFNIHQEKIISNYNIKEIDIFLSKIKKILPFEPYDFQEKAFKESILNVKQINKCCTSSGKSLIISLIAEFFREQNKKGLLLVPNINLLTQFKNDIKDYKLIDLYDDCHVIGGGSTERHFNNSLTISTWQSMMNYHNNLDELNYVICDEAHRFASEETSAIVKKTINCQYKIGFTGTIPDNPIQKMELLGLFGMPKTYITSSELIDRKLATPIKINSIIFQYNKTDKNIFRNAGNYPKQLKFIKEHEKRNEFIVNLVLKLKQNKLVLFQHTEHGKTIFSEIMKKKYPELILQNKYITGKKSFDFQEQYGIYFLNGEDDARTREKTRKILEKTEDTILVANFALLSTGVSIKRLHHLIMASPLKSYTTITQSLGRGMRLHESKDVFNVFDLTDNFGVYKPGGIFYKQYIHRKNTSYNPENFPIKEVNFNLF